MSDEYFVLEPDEAERVHLGRTKWFGQFVPESEAEQARYLLTTDESLWQEFRSVSLLAITLIEAGIDPDPRIKAGSGAIDDTRLTRCSFDGERRRTGAEQGAVHFSTGPGEKQFLVLRISAKGTYCDGSLDVLPCLHDHYLRRTTRAALGRLGFTHEEGRHERHQVHPHRPEHL
ncbi:hypothetical protein [Amnibacterium kyonggiense]|uniref:Uncharacterized protein n=1 Tax=Amnibacterium kyonggiense TaxID=595671 RepID=A0A4R7FCL3_9MICO|nr:hypothetical protein [Amnibacterium kyonggiense]TDS74501.1 hypothetical protein CLV52_3684 [Amnibacterium kyonggiense]